MPDVVSAFTRTATSRTRVSVVIPAYNAESTIADTLDSLLRQTHQTWEALVVDDGSNDGTTERLRQIALRDARVKLIEFRRNYGQTAALDAGLRHASGDVIVTIDADLQNDPADIPKLLAEMDSCDFVCGVRAKRRDTWMRRVSSRVARRAWVR